MSTPLAPWSIFRTSAIAAEGLPWIENGFHLRTKISPLIGFPLHPFAAWRLQVSDEWTEVDIIWSDADKRSHLMPFNIEDMAAGTMGSIVGASAEDPWVWIEVVLEDRGARIDLLGGSVASGHSSPILATRTRDPFRFGGAQISRLLVSGHGTVQAVRGIRLSDIDIWDLHRSPDLTFGLPLEQGPWYAPDPATDPRIAAEQRVRMAAPRRLSPPDNPTGQGPDDTDPDAETARIMEVIGPSLVDPWLVKAFGDPQVAPVDAVFSEQSVTAVGAPLSTNAAVVPSLLTMDVDPQIARYIGLSTMIAFDRTAPEQAANVWLVASRWAVQRDRILRRFLGAPALKLDAYLQSTANTPAWLDTALATAFPGATAIIDNLPNVPDRAGDGPWSAVTLLTLAVAAGKAPPDPPDSFRLSAAEPGAWNAQDPDNRGPESWQQQISLGRHPARGMVGFARISPGAPETLHRREPPPEQGYVSRALPLVPNWAGSNRRLLADVEIPPDPGGARWLVWHADEFGQWSEAAELSMPLPPRPKPPPPVAEVTFSPHPADRSAGARIPGKLHLRLEVPRNIHLPPGSLPIAGLEVTVDGVILPLLDVVPGEAAFLDAEPKAFDIGEYRDVPIAARFIDEEGTRSAETMINAQAYDARAPQAIPSSPMIIWTGQTDATGQAQLSLGWPPQAGADRYRVYMGDARRLAGDLGITLPDTLVRARHSRPIYNLAQNISSKDAFTLVGEAGGKAGDDGRIHFQTQIPGALRNVQFVRIVPLPPEAPRPTSTLAAWCR